MANLTPQNFSSRLKLFRKSAGALTQEKAADCLGVSLASYRKYERGEHLPDIRFLRNAAELFSVSADRLLGLTEIDDPQEAAIRASLRDYTGLSEAAIENLYRADPETKTAINILLGSDYGLLKAVALSIAQAKSVFSYGGSALPRPTDSNPPHPEKCINREG